jgi:hypothetical protein
MVRTGVTFADAAAEFLRYSEQDRGCKPSTLRDYRSNLHAHLLPAFGDRPVVPITAREINAWRASLGQLSNGTKNKLLVAAASAGSGTRFGHRRRATGRNTPARPSMDSAAPRGADRQLGASPPTRPPRGDRSAAVACPAWKSSWTSSMSKYSRLPPRLTFEDGVIGDVSFEDCEWHGAFEPFNDPSVFAQVYVDAQYGTICWPNRLDMAPEPLYEAARRHPASTAPSAGPRRQ